MKAAHMKLKTILNSDIQVLKGPNNISYCGVVILMVAMVLFQWSL